MLVIGRLLWNMFRSVMFLTTFVTIIYSSYDYVHLTPLVKWLSNTTRNRIISIISTTGIAWEQPHRRVDITYYIVPRSLEIYWNMLKNRKLVSDFTGQNVSLVRMLTCSYRRYWSLSRWESWLGSFKTKENGKRMTNKAAGKQTNTHCQSEGFRSASVEVCGVMHLC